MEVSTASRALATIAASLSCSTMIGSTRMPDWNLISSMAGRSVGSATREEQPLAAEDEGQHLVLGQQALVHGLDRLHVDVDGVQVEQGHAELGGGGHGDLAGPRSSGGPPGRPPG